MFRNGGLRVCDVQMARTWLVWVLHGAHMAWFNTVAGQARRTGFAQYVSSKGLQCAHATGMVRGRTARQTRLAEAPPPGKPAARCSPGVSATQRALQSTQLAMVAWLTEGKRTKAHQALLSDTYTCPPPLPSTWKSCLCACAIRVCVCVYRPSLQGGPSAIVSPEDIAGVDSTHLRQPY